jgi:hypothetical protein
MTGKGSPESLPPQKISVRAMYFTSNPLTVQMAVPFAGCRIMPAASEMTGEERGKCIEKKYGEIPVLSLSVFQPSHSGDDR